MMDEVMCPATEYDFECSINRVRKRNKAKKTILLRGPIPYLCFHIGSEGRRSSLAYSCRKECEFYWAAPSGECEWRDLSNGDCESARAQEAATKELIVLAKVELDEMEAKP